MENKEYYELLIARHNQEFGTQISLEEVSGNGIFPEVELTEQVILFSDHLEHLMRVFNLFSKERQVGSRAIHHFLLYHLAMERNMYSKAEELLLLLQEEMDVLKPSREENEAFGLLVALQVSIALGHEMSHIYYAQHPDVRKGHVEAMRKQVISYKEQFNTDKPLLIKLLHFFSKKIKRLQEQSYDEAIGRDDLLEELCCDETAWRMVGSMIDQLKLDSDVAAEVCAHVGLSLAFAQTKRTLENIYLDPGQDVRDRDLRFDTSRHTLQNKIVWEYMDGYGKKASRQFQSLINDYRRIGYAVLMHSLKKEYDHIGYIRFMPKGEYSPKEMKRLDAIYRNLWRKSW